MRKIIFLLSCLCLFCTCRNKQNTDVAKDPTKINRTVLGVSLMDNRNQVKEKIEKQGYRLEGYEMFLSLKEKYSFSGFDFDDLTFAFYDAKVYTILLTKELESEEAAKCLFYEVEKILNEKYSKFKADDKNDSFLLNTVFDDKETNLSLSVLYKPKEDVPPLFRDSETLHNTREHWELIIIYSPSGNALINENKYDF